MGTALRLMPMKDSEVLALSHGEIKKPNLAIKAKNMKPEKNGLFDPEITGGKKGQRWGHIRLADPLPNPVYAKSTALVLGIKEKDIPAIISGEKELPNGRSGAEGIKESLKEINVSKAWQEARDQLHDPKLKRAKTE